MSRHIFSVISLDFLHFRYPTHKQYEDMIAFILTKWPHLAEDETLALADVKVNLISHYWKNKVLFFISHEWQN
jgi:hypothetical protein